MDDLAASCVDTNLKALQVKTKFELCEYNLMGRLSVSCREFAVVDVNVYCLSPYSAYTPIPSLM